VPLHQIERERYHLRCGSVVTCSRLLAPLRIISSTTSVRRLESLICSSSNNVQWVGGSPALAGEHGRTLLVQHVFRHGMWSWGVSVLCGRLSRHLNGRGRTNTVAYDRPLLVPSEGAVARSARPLRTFEARWRAADSYSWKRRKSNATGSSRS
jgi:hypothetical protein